MTVLLFFAFVSGLVTIFAPCIWPLLPIILSSTATGGNKKPLGITLGIITSFAVFTLTLSYIIRIIPFDPNVLRLFAVIVIGFLGLTLVIPKLSAILESYVSRFSGKLGTGQNRSGFWGGFITGFSLGLVWTPCAGPILATIATLAATASVSFQVVLVTIAYVVGVGIPLFIFATVGRILLTKTRSISAYTGRIQQVFGIVMILTAIAIFTNYDKVLQAKLLDAVPSYSNFVTNFESNDTVKKQLDELKGKKSIDSTDTNGLFNAHTPAPELTGVTNWLNTEGAPTISELKGHVVLVDFWTYTCINCIRTLPFVTSWYDKYSKDGFIVIGVHTPEFAFEKETKNVENAIKQYNIHYPVAQDNDFATWNAFSNQYWPAEYLIDAKGIIRRTHFGEGEYDQMEMAIQTLLKESGKKINTKLSDMPDQTPHAQMSPETYIGAKRMEYYYPSGNTGVVEKSFTLSDDLSLNSFSLGGMWNIMDEYAVTKEKAVLNYNFTASKVFLVMRPPKDGKATVKVYLDGVLIDSSKAGADVENGTIIVDTDRLYTLVDLKGKVQTHILKLEFETADTSVFAFTFG